MNQGVIHTMKRGTGNRDYTLARLKRDHTAIFAAYERREFTSGRAAARRGVIAKVV